MAQMRTLSGYDDCTDHHCLQEDGSGFYLVKPDEYTMGETSRNIATHLFFRTGIAPESDLLPSFVEQVEAWCMQSNLDWLANTTLRGRGSKYLNHQKDVVLSLSTSVSASLCVILSVFVVFSRF
eukprot:TRINITY_DN9981_c0_g1_i4.p1 TRINITY_DN9981_c0_g1~~TRINITY_DN9981_c0_g1_i4.p1  ORF type:complete len:124 (-),score=14.48 TRINITY_DN9981_c0_g1_i4:255-626(-)